jgi:hypothetical protein
MSTAIAINARLRQAPTKVVPCAALSLNPSPDVRFLVAARRFFDSVGGFRGESAEFEIALNARRAELIE